MINKFLAITIEQPLVKFSVQTIRCCARAGLERLFLAVYFGTFVYPFRLAFRLLYTAVFGRLEDPAVVVPRLIIANRPRN